MTAVGNMFRKIGLTYRLRGNLQFNEFLSKRDAKEMTGPFRLAWVMDYPSIENFLAPQYATAALAPPCSASAGSGACVGDGGAGGSARRPRRRRRRGSATSASSRTPRRWASQA